MRAILRPASWCYNVNLYGLKKDELGPYLTINENLESYFSTLYEGTWNFSVPINGTLLQYIDKSETLELTMWILNAPVLVMLLFYTYMVAKMIIEDDKNEISSLKWQRRLSKADFLPLFFGMRRHIDLFPDCRAASGADSVAADRIGKWFS